MTLATPERSAFVEPASSALLLLGRGVDLASERGVECAGALPPAGNAASSSSPNGQAAASALSRTSASASRAASDLASHGSQGGESAIEGAKLRFRPVMMTSFAFILGLVPLILATGPGSASRIAVGSPVFYGMLAAASAGILLIPMLYVVFQYLRERTGWRPAPPHLDDRTHAIPPPAE